VKYLKKKLFSLTIVAIIAIGSLASVYGYHELIWEWEGAGHSACGHQGVTGAAESAIGTLVLTVNETDPLAPYQKFTLEIDVLNFTEAIPDPYYRRIMVCIPGMIGDNDDFSSSPGTQIMNRRERVDDTYGSYDPSDTDNVFELIAPGAAGNYTLFGLVLAGFNHSGSAPAANDAEMNITFIQDSVDIEVVAPAGPGNGNGNGTPVDSIPGFLTIVLVSSISIAVFAVVLKVRRKKRIID